MPFNISALSIRPSLPSLEVTMPSILSFGDDLPSTIANARLICSSFGASLHCGCCYTM